MFKGYMIRRALCPGRVRSCDIPCPIGRSGSFNLILIIIIPGSIDPESVVLGGSLVPPWCLPGASLHPLTWSLDPFWTYFVPLAPPKDQHESLQTHFGATLGPLDAHFWHMRVAVKDFGVTLSLLWVHFLHMRMSLGSLCCRLVPMKLNFKKHSFSQ